MSKRTCTAARERLKDDRAIILARRRAFGRRVAQRDVAVGILGRGRLSVCVIKILAKAVPYFRHEKVGVFLELRLVRAAFDLKRPGGLLASEAEAAASACHEQDQCCRKSRWRHILGLV